jgi:uncharacterized low-complexity protein
MSKRVLAAALATALLVTTAATGPVLAQAQPSGTAAPAAKPSDGRAAMRERQKKCGAEWKEAKAAGKIEKGMTWPKYWSACNTRLKASG